jgi:hypothetical protein
MLNDRLRIVGSNNASTTFLKLDRSFPGLVNVLRWELFEDWDPFSDIVSVLILVLEERDR